MTFQTPDLSAFLPALLQAIPSVLVILFSALFLNYFIKKGLTLFARKTRFTEHDIMPIRRLIGWTIFSVATLFILGALGLNLGGLWGVLSTVLAMVAIGFVAVWSVLSNTLCTLIILVFRPFSIGDEIEFPGDPIKGNVKDLNFIFTTLSCEDGSLLQIPNNLFFQKIIRRRPSGSTVSLTNKLKERSAAAESGIPVR
jgi:small-conductance mechanosensitive channel